MSDRRVEACNKYIRELEDKLLEKTIGQMHQKELFLEQQKKRIKTYLKIKNGETLEPISQSDAEYFVDSIQDDITGLSKAILEDRAEIAELERKRREQR